MTRKIQNPAMARRYELRRRLYEGRRFLAPGNPVKGSEGKADTAELEKLQKECADLREVALRQRAEFENFRKRTQRDKDTVRDLAAEGLLSRMLPVLDNIERAIVSAANATEVKPVYDGVKMILIQLKRALEAEGLEQVQALDQPFDPALHDALATEERTDVADNQVVEELLPGYRFKEKLLRPAMVKVAKAPQQSEEISI